MRNGVLGEENRRAGLLAAGTLAVAAVLVALRA
jgi:hypothetical protein